MLQSASTVLHIQKSEQNKTHPFVHWSLCTALSDLQCVFHHLDILHLIMTCVTHSIYLLVTQTKSLDSYCIFFRFSSFDAYNFPPFFLSLTTTAAMTGRRHCKYIRVHAFLNLKTLLMTQCKHSFSLGPKSFHNLKYIKRTYAHYRGV